MTSAPLAARSARSSSVMSPATNSTCSPGAIGPSPSDDTSTKSPAAARSSRVPTERLSTTLTACPPSSIRDRIRDVPIKPQPPVTNHFTRTAPGRDCLPSFLYLRAYPSLPRVVCRAYLRRSSLRYRSTAGVAVVRSPTPWLACFCPGARGEGAYPHAQGLSQGGRCRGRRGYHARCGRVRQPGQQLYTSARRVPSERGIENERDTGYHRQSEKRPPRGLRQRLDTDSQP